MLQKSIALAKQMEKFNSVEDFLNIVKGVPESEKPSFIAGKCKCTYKIAINN